MQKERKKPKKWLVAAGIVIVAGVAAALIWAGTHQSPESSLDYDQLLELAEGASLSEVEQQAGSASGASSASAASSEQTSESAASEAASESEPESTVMSEAASGSDADEENTSSTASSASASQSNETSSAATSVSSTAASQAATSTSHETSSSHAASASASAPASHSASSTASAASAAHSSSTVNSLTRDEECDQKLAEYVKQIEQLQTSSEQKLYGILYDAWDEYMSHPAEERNLALKVSVVLSKTGDLTSAQSECDKQFNAIIKEMRKTLEEYGRDSTLADEAEKTYKQKKNDMIKELTDQAYSGGDGSGQSGKWLAEHAGKTS